MRASSLPLLFRCPASQLPCEVPISTSNDAAALGQAVHEALRSLAETGSVRWDDVPTIAKRHGVPEDDVRPLCWMAQKLWPELQQWFSDSITELFLSMPLVADGKELDVLTGHVDNLAIDGPSARASDWKTGRKDSDYAHQMRAYCSLILHDNPDLKEATSTVIWLREGEVENYTMTRSDKAQWDQELIERVVQWDRRTHFPGGHCQYCGRSHECPAMQAMARRDVAILSGDAIEAQLAEMPDDRVISLLQKARMIEETAAGVREAIKRHTKARGELIGGGHRLTIRDTDKRHVRPMEAWPVLQAHLDEEDLADCLRISISKVESFVAKAAGRGKGAGAVRRLRAELDEANALYTTTTEELEIKRHAG